MLGWIVALILFVVLLRDRDSIKVKALRAQLALLSGTSSRSTEPFNRNSEDQALILEIAILRLNLLHASQSGQLEKDSLPHLLRQVDKLLQNELKRQQIAPDSIEWQERSLAAWHILTKRGYAPEGPAPWQQDEPELETIVVEDQELPTFDLTSTVQSKTTSLVGHLQKSPQEISLDSQKEESVEANSSVSLSSIAEELPGKSQIVGEILPASEEQTAWQPRKPSELEKALRAVSGWPKVVLPFLVQNIGWFIGGFCFLAGSIFLVSYTTGFAKGFVVFAALFSYTLFLIWFGYRLQLKDSIAKTAGEVLLVMGMFLVPLNISAIVRLLVSANGSLLLTGLGLLATFLALAVYYYLAKLVAGVVDRTLQGVYPLIFLSLASIQLGVPLLDFWPIWQLMAFFHLLLLGLLSYGVYYYVHNWMRSIFVEQRKIAYFAGGILLYTACVSFIHLTWCIESLEIPKGYYAPYIMVVCGLLFYLESQFKQWVHQNVFLSRFTFALYGISILALVLAADGATMVLTLGLAVIIYGLVVWQHLTMVPLYLLLAALVGLYYTLILRYFTGELYLLLSLPGLAGLFILSNYIRTRCDKRVAVFRLALIVYQVQTFLLVVLAVWSLVNSQAGMIGFSTALLLIAGLWWILRAAPGSLSARLSTLEGLLEREQTSVNLNNTSWFYTVTLATTIALAFLPGWWALSWASQFSLGLMVLACFWAWQAIRYRLQASDKLVEKIEVLTNSALLNVIIAFALVYPSQLWETNQWLLPLLCTIGAGVLLSLSLGLYVRWLFYGFLIVSGIAVGLFKHAFFPGTSVGMMKVLVGLGLWLGLWWLESQSDRVEQISRQRLQLTVPLSILWSFPVSHYEQNKSAPDTTMVKKDEQSEGGADV
jgi:hypothetical protein